MLYNKGKTDGFLASDFIDFIRQEFPSIYRGNCYVRELVENLIGYGLEHENESKDQFCDFLADIIPEISFGEVAMFMDDRHLTEYGTLEKQSTLENFNDKEND